MENKQVSVLYILIYIHIYIIIINVFIHLAYRFRSWKARDKKESWHNDWVVHRRRISKRVWDGIHEASLGWTALTKRVWDGRHSRSEFGMAIYRSVYLTMDSFLTMQIDVCFIRNLKPADLGGYVQNF